MTSDWPSSRVSAQSATRILLQLLDDPESDNTRLVQGYLDAKRQLATAFQSLLTDSVDEDEVFREFIDQLESTMTATFPQVPAKYRVVTGYGATHRRLFSYLVRREGIEVPVEELRLLTHDAVHTERRIRELRDLGVRLEMTDNGGRQNCRLSIPKSLTEVGRTWIAKQIDGDRSLSDRERETLRKLTADG